VRLLSRAADGREIAIAEPARIESSTGFVHWDGKPYRETLALRSAGSFCEVVNELDVEKYLEGIVNSEFNSRWNPEAIGAQVIAARTYALFQMKIARADDTRTFDVDASTSDQVYGGTRGEDHRAAQVVARTQGWVLTAAAVTSRLEPLKAFYHSTCGGSTELPENVWRQSFTGFKRKVRCPYCASSPAWNWSLEVSRDELARELRRGLQGDDFLDSGWAKSWPRDWKTIVSGGRLAMVAPIQEKGTDRIERVSTLWSVTRSAGRETVSLVIPAARLRDWLGPARLRSTFFRVASAGQSGAIKFEGHGNGHGVGMCQWGAKMMGDRGFKTASILKFYYPDAALKKLW
jgi:stage II sporulation protein D